MRNVNQNGSLPDLLISSTNVAIKTAAAVMLISKFNNGQLMLFSFLAEMLSYVKYLQITYPPRLRYILEQPEPEFISIEYLSSFPEELQEYFAKYPLQIKFESYEFHSSFLINFWPSLVMLVIIILSIIISMILVCVTKSCKRIHDKFLHLKQALKWNYLKAVFTGYNTNIAMFTSLEMRTVQFNYEVFFDSYKENSFAQQLYFPLFSLRLYLFYVIVSYLFEYPLIQAIIIKNVLGIVTLIYLGITRPFKEKMEMIISGLQEFILQIVNISGLVLAITDKGDNDTEDVRVVFGDIIIGCNVAFLLISLIFTFITIIILFKEIFNTIRNSCRKKPPVTGKDRVLNRRNNFRLHIPSRHSSDVSSVNESQLHLNASFNKETPLDDSVHGDSKSRSKPFTSITYVKRDVKIDGKASQTIFSRSRPNHLKKPR